jgi:hypothetical protein
MFWVAVSQGRSRARDSVITIAGIAVFSVRLSAIHSFLRSLRGECPEHLAQAQRILRIPFNELLRVNSSDRTRRAGNSGGSGRHLGGPCSGNATALLDVLVSVPEFGTK